MMQASGLFNLEKYIAIAGSTLNLIVSFVLGKTIGIAGILLGTICTYVLQYYLKLFIFYKKILHKSCLKLMLLTWAYFLLTAAECFSLSFALSKLPDFNPYLKFIISGICAVVFSLGVNCLIFRKTPEFNYFTNKTLSVIKKKLGKSEV